MMSEPTTVDGLTTDELTGKIVLLIEEDRAWHETDVMHRQLAAKVRHYVRYIRSTNFAEEHGERPEDTIVRLVSSDPPGKASLHFFERVSWELDKHGIAFEHQLGDEGIPTTIAATAPGEAPGPPVRPAVEPPQEPKVEPAAPEAEVLEPEAEVLEPTAEVLEPEAEVLEPMAEVLEPTAEVSAPTPAETPEPPAEAEPPLELEEPLAEPAAPPPAEASEPVAGPEVPAEPEPPFAEELPWEPAAMEGPSELERLIESDEQLEHLLEDVEEEPVGLSEPEPVAAAETAGAAKARRPPPFFPEEEFGRAIPDMDEVEAILRSPDEPAVIETPSGKQISLEAPPKAKAAARAARRRPPGKLVRATLAATSSALAGAVVWALLSVGAGHGASPLAVAIGLMVGISVRLRGEGHTLPFRLIGVGGTLFGSAIGAVLATAALSALQDDRGIGGIASLLGGFGSIWAALDRFYGPLDLVPIALALYLAFRLAASKPPAEPSGKGRSAPRRHAI